MAAYRLGGLARRACGGGPALAGSRGLAAVVLVGGFGAGLWMTAALRPDALLLHGSRVAEAAAGRRPARLSHGGGGLSRFQAVTASGAEVSLAEPPYNAKVVLIVNVASE